MWLKSLTLKHFRNYEEAEITFHSGLNVFLGQNAQGKTNILESIYFLALTRSHRTRSDKDFIHFQEKELKVSGVLEKKTGTIPLDIELTAKGRITKINHLKQNRLSDYIGTMNVVLFAPEDLQLIKGSPSLRRKFIETASEVFETSFVPLGADRATGATVFERQEPAQPISQEQHMDLETLKKEYPELVQAVATETLASLNTETLKTACPELASELLTAGAERERGRIAEVREQCIPGHEALIARLELDGKSTGADAAKAIVAAEKAARLQAAASLAQTGNPPVPMAGDPDSGTGTAMKREVFNRLGDRARREALDAGVAIVE